MSVIKQFGPNWFTTIMVCRSGGRSAKACEYLAGQGHRNVKNMVGGMLSWNGDTV